VTALRSPSYSPHMEPHETIVGIVLAGGRSSRMGGGDKCVRPLSGKPVLAHVLARLRPQVSDIVISANSDQFAGFGLPVVADASPEFQGPLAGVAAGLEWVAANRPDVAWAVTVPGDTPFIPADLVRGLAAADRAAGTMAVARSETGVHPVVAVWPVGMASDLKAALAGGLRKVSRWAEMQGATQVFFPASDIGGREVDPFFNINRKEDLVEAEGLLRREPEPS
jgi:molybdopterin-guanine dinucleotide biosynthesis protein A